MSIRYYFFGTPMVPVKYEEVYIHDYLSPREARQALTRYFTFYNQERLHQALDYQTPAEVYFHKA